MENKKVVVPLIKESYLAVIQNGVGARLFQNFYAMVNGDKEDIMRGGELSCAFFVSTITAMFGLSKKIHGTVDGTVKDLLESGWLEIAKPKIGAILVWAEQMEAGEKHKHIGFYVGNNQAVSNSSVDKTPAKHHWTFKEKRQVVKVLYRKIV